MPFGDSVSMRKVYGETLVLLGKENPRLVVLSADVSNSDHSFMFEKAFPERFFNVGIAEQALVDTAVGFALDGKIPVANTFAFLFATRALEQIRTHMGFGRANVKLAGAYAGLSDSFDGPTHHSITDLAIIRSLPNLTVVVPADSTAVQKLLKKIVDFKGPVYFRLCRNEVPVIFNDSYQPEIGKGIILKNGSNITLISCGVMVSRCLQAAQDLDKQGINTRVVEMHTIKPLDHDLIRKCASETGNLVTVEEHSIIGGLGSAVAESISELRDVRLRMVGIQDQFAESGPYEELLEKYGLSKISIIENVKDILKKRNK
jgi:transketolase